MLVDVMKGIWRINIQSLCRMKCLQALLKSLISSCAPSFSKKIPQKNMIGCLHYEVQLIICLSSYCLVIFCFCDTGRHYCRITYTHYCIMQQLWIYNSTRCPTARTFLNMTKMSFTSAIEHTTL